jgi:hypothetical protein
MTEQTFQKTVLNSLQKQEGFNKTVLNSLRELKDRVTTLEVFTENQFTEQKEFNEKLFVIVENEIVDRLKTESDYFKGYADGKIHTHEVKFRHEAVA